MRAAALIALGLALGAAMPAGADVDLTDLDARITQLETTDACRMVAPFSIQQLHHSTKRTLALTNSGAYTLNHPGEFAWVVLVDPSCVKDIS